MDAKTTSLSELVAPQVLADAHRRALESHSLVSMSDTNGVITYANERFCELFGYTLDELVGQTYALINSSHSNPAVFDEIWKTVRAGKNWTGEVCNRTKDGRLIWCDAIVVPMINAQGQVIGHFSVRRNISARKSAEQELEIGRQFLLDISELANVGGYSLDLVSGELYWSDQTKRIHEVPPDYKPDLAEAIEFYAPEARPTITNAVESSIRDGGSWDLELPMITAKGRRIWVRAVGHSVWERGEPVRIVGAFQDITERKSAEDVLRDEVQNRHSAERLLRDVLETLPNAVAAFDPDDRLMICNAAYKDIYAASADAIVPGASFEDILRFGLARGQYHGVSSDPKVQQAWLDARLEAHRNPPDELIQRLRDGRWLQVREHRSAEGVTVGTRTDITGLKNAEAELRRFAETDQLTGLLNRGSFSARLGTVLDEVAEGGRTGCCVGLFDIDHFKPINDAYGHDIGDEVLRGTAERLLAVLGADDFAARLGGDEFVFMMANGREEADFEARIIALFEAMQEPFFTRAGEIKATLSLGLAAIDQRTHHAHVTSRHVLKFADLAQYRAKQEGRGRWQWFDAEDALAIANQEQLTGALMQDLQEGKGFHAELIPIGDAHDAALLGFSNHISWHLDGRVIGGGELYKIAQRVGKTTALCTLALEAALRAFGEAHERGAPAGQLWLSAHRDHVKLDTFVATLETLRESNALPAQSITVAVHEGAFSDRSAGAIIKTFKALDQLGYRLGVDSFGANAVAPTLLHDLDVHAVRLSPQITDPLAQSESDDRLVRGQIALAKSLDFEVLASDANSALHAARLADLGCDALQGEVISSAPVACDTLLTYLAERARQDLQTVLPASDKTKKSAA